MRPHLFANHRRVSSRAVDDQFQSDEANADGIRVAVVDLREKRVAGVGGGDAAGDRTSQRRQPPRPRGATLPQAPTEAVRSVNQAA